MGYVDQNLMPGEQVLIRAKIHWGVFVNPILYLVFGLILGAFIWFAGGENEYIYAVWCPGLMVFSGAIGFLSGLISYFTTEFAVTDRRIIAKRGSLFTQSLELMMNKVESIGVTQPLMGRVLSYGTIVVTGSGGTKQRFPNISDPMALRQRINAQIAGLSQGEM
jgi:uncharacterized membrane protein YdbT with pleckstrin-like domain